MSKFSSRIWCSSTGLPRYDLAWFMSDRFYEELIFFFFFQRAVLPIMKPFTGFAADGFTKQLWCFFYKVSDRLAHPVGKNLGRKCRSQSFFDKTRDDPQANFKTAGIWSQRQRLPRSAILTDLDGLSTNGLLRHLRHGSCGAINSTVLRCPTG